MKEDLYRICEEVLADKKESKKLLEYETLDELYEYFQEKLPSLTKDEFDEFVCEALESYVKEQENVNNLGEKNLASVSGGAVGWKSKATAAFLAAMSIFSAVPGVGAGYVDDFDNEVEMSQSISTKEKIKMKISDAYQKTKEWIKNHKGLAIGIGVGATAVIVGGTVLAVKHSLNKKKDSNKNVGNLNTSSAERAPIGKEPTAPPPTAPRTPKGIMTKIDKGEGLSAEQQKEALGEMEKLVWNARKANGNLVQELCKTKSDLHFKTVSLIGLGQLRSFLEEKNAEIWSHIANYVFVDQRFKDDALSVKSDLEKLKSLLESGISKADFIKRFGNEEDAPELPPRTPERLASSDRDGRGPATPPR